MQSSAVRDLFSWSLNDCCHWTLWNKILIHYFSSKEENLIKFQSACLLIGAVELKNFKEIRAKFSLSEKLLHRSRRASILMWKNFGLIWKMLSLASKTSSLLRRVSSWISSIKSEKGCVRLENGVRGGKQDLRKSVLVFWSLAEHIQN